MKKLHIVLLLILLLVTTFFIFYQKQKCDEVGGVIVRGLWGLECIMKI